MTKLTTKITNLIGILELSKQVDILDKNKTWQNLGYPRQTLFGG